MEHVLVNAWPVPTGIAARATAAARAIAFLLPVLSLQACFDVQHVDPGDGHFLIDDFEDGDSRPSTPLFDRWFCYVYNPVAGVDPAQTVTCDLETTPGDNSTFALFAAFSLHDPPDGTGHQDFGGGAVMTEAEFPVDFRTYHDLVFNMRVESSELPAAYAQVQLGCNTVALDQAAPPGTYPYTAVQNLPLVNTWAAFRLPLSKFSQPDYQAARFTGGSAACLAIVDSVHFDVQGQLGDGRSGSGVIHIDDVHLE
jgi:hypothetical protein